MTDHYSLWCVANGCDHGHCPEGCEHPQPIAVVMKGETNVRLICLRCWVVDLTITDMVPCVPGACE